MDISVSKPLEHAWNRMVDVCFRPFDAAKWFTLGFCAWLASLASGGGSFNYGSDNGGSGGGGGGKGALEFVQMILDWCAENAVLVVAGLAGLFLVGLAVAALVLWLRSRGEFMLLDGIARNRGAVREPWREYKTLGDSLFLVRMALTLVMTGWMFAVLLAGLFSWWPSVVAHWLTLGNDVSFGEFLPGDLWVAMAVVTGLTLALMLLLGVIGAVIDRLVVPVMYARDATVGQAWQAVRAAVLPGHLGTVVLYFLMLILVSLGLGLVGLIAMIVTCCIATLPYIGAVILLPLAVFERAYVMYFVEQFGFDIFRFDPDDDPRDDPALALGSTWSARI